MPACVAQEGNKAQNDFTEGYNGLVGMDHTVPDVRSTFDNDINVDATPTQSSERRMGCRLVYNQSVTLILHSD